MLRPNIITTAVAVCLVLTNQPWRTAHCQALPCQTYSTRDGLPSNHVTAIYQDVRGYLWIGTDNGLSLYDGIEFKNFTTADGLPNLYITDITESRVQPGIFYIGTIAGGLVRMQGGHFAAFRFGKENVSNLYEDGRGGLWCSTEEGNFRIINDSVAFVCATSRVGSNIQGIDDSTVAIFTGREMRRYHVNGELKGVERLDFVGTERVLATTLASRGDVWGISSNGNLLEMHGSRVTSHRLLLGNRFSPNIPSSMVDDGRGSFWLTTVQGVVVVNKQDFTFRLLHHLGSSREQRCGPILRDREGIIWVGTYSGGLLKLSEQRISHIPLGRICEGAYYMVACSDSSGHIWIAAPTSLLEVARTQNRQWKTFHHPKDPRYQAPVDAALLIDSRNRLWVGPTTERQHPFCCYEIKNQKSGSSRLRLVKSLLPSVFAAKGVGLTFAVDRFQRGWFSISQPGVALVDLRSNTLARTLTQGNGLPSDAPRALLVDRTGTLWYGTWNEGLSVIQKQGDSFSVSSGPAMISGAGVRSLFEDTEGGLWIGTRYGGLVRRRDGEYTNISVTDGLLSNAIWSIAETGNRIWCGTDVGLEMVDKKSCKPFPPKSELIGDRVYACGSFKNEYVWCVNSNELVVYEHPEEMPTTPPPPVYVRSYSVNGVAMSPDSVHIFDHNQNSCTIDFVGISFKDEHNVRYRYRLLGHDSVWAKPVKEHSVTYSSLRPGSYQFEVRAINGDGVQSVLPATVSFVIVPPIWSRWWFIIGIASLFLALLFGLFRYRLYHMMTMERMRLRIASDLHDDVGTNLSSIVVSSQIMERDPSITGEVRNQLKDIGAVAASAQEMMRDIVWMLNPSNDSLDDFIFKMKEAASRLLSDIPVIFVVPQERMLEKVSIEFKRNVFLMFKEMLNNIARHSHATNVVVEVAHDGGMFTLRVADNGSGFDIGQASLGSGISSLKRRAELIGGSIEFARSSDGGTIVTLLVKNHANA
jgi:ligand-binding sensor domain-containing protein/signal transduction histidine kinase